jgi:hypothetical protein
VPCTGRRLRAARTRSSALHCPRRRKSDEKDKEDALREGCQLIFVTFLLDPTGLNPNVKHERQRVVIRSFVVTTFLTGPLDLTELVSVADLT